MNQAISANIFSLMNQKEVKEKERTAFRTNRILPPFFSERRFVLVDFKLDFGLPMVDILIGDEIAPYSCKIWEKKLDKDVFRFDMGDFMSSYRSSYRRPKG